MALRIIFILIGIAIVINIVITSVGLILGVNLYERYGKQILNFFTIFIVLIIAVFVALSLIALK